MTCPDRQDTTLINKGQYGYSTYNRTRPFDPPLEGTAERPCQDPHVSRPSWPLYAKSKSNVRVGNYDIDNFLTKGITPRHTFTFCGRTRPSHLHPSLKWQQKFLRVYCFVRSSFNMGKRDLRYRHSGIERNFHCFDDLNRNSCGHYESLSLPKPKKRNYQ